MNVATKTARNTAHRRVAYAEDFYTWTQEQAALLRAGDLSALNRENLAEEIESLGRSGFNGLAGAWRVILLHMLKFDHQPWKQTRSWTISIAAHRDDAADIQGENPGLKSRPDGVLARAYRGARLDASNETALPLKRFPEECPYTHEALLTRPFPIDPDNATS